MGRNRKAGARQPGGKLRPVQDQGLPGSVWQRARALGLDPLGGTQVGRLRIVGRLTDAQVSAAHRVAEVYARYERSIGMRRTAASPSYEAGSGRAPGDETQAENERNQAAAKAFNAMQSVITSVQPGCATSRALRAAIEALCCEDRVCPPGMGLLVAEALAVLAAHFGISGVTARPTRPTPLLSPAAAERQNHGLAQGVKRGLIERDQFVATLTQAGIDPETAIAKFAEYRARVERERFRQASGERIAA